MFSTSTRNFPNRLGATPTCIWGQPNWPPSARALGRIPTKAEYMADIGVLDANAADIYRYMNFDQIEDYQIGEKTAA